MVTATKVHLFHSNKMKEGKINNQKPEEKNRPFFIQREATSNGSYLSHTQSHDHKGDSKRRGLIELLSIPSFSKTN